MKINTLTILSYVCTSNEIENNIQLKRYEKMIEQIKKFRDLLKSLEDLTDEESSEDECGSSSSEDECGSSSSSQTESSPSEESGSSSSQPQSIEETLATNPPVRTHNTIASIHVVGFGGFSVFSRQIIFANYFYFYNRKPPLIIVFTITILYTTRIRYLDETTNNAKNETTKCTLIEGSVSESEQGYIYNCTAPRASQDIKQILVIPELTLINEDGKEEVINATSNEINFSEEAALGMQNLQTQIKSIDKTYILKNGEKIEYPNKYFVIKGNNDAFDGKVGSKLWLIIFDNTTNPTTSHNVSCLISKVSGTNYEFKCTPTEDVKGTLYLSPMYYNESIRINLNMTEPNSQYIDFKISKNSTSDDSIIVKNNPIYNKSSSGLSGGAIAGIVISCAVVLITSFFKVRYLYI